MANHTVARIFERPTYRSDLRLVRNLEHPEGRLKNRDITSDKPGRNSGPGSHKSAGMGTFNGQGRAGRGGSRPPVNNKHGYQPHETPEQRTEHQFSREIASFLHDARSRNEFNGLILVAEPHVLGAIREALDKPTGDKVLASFSKNLVKLPDSEVGIQLAAVLDAVDAQGPFLESA